MKNDNIILSTEKLCKTFSTGGMQQHILRNLDVKVKQGDFTVIMGSSGAGKSTLLYALSGMDKPTLGKVMFAGEEISGYTNDQLAIFRRKHCGFVFQQIYLIDSMSVIDNVLASGLLMNKNHKTVAERARQLLSTVGIDEITQRKFPTQLSGGESQRVGIIRALINNPHILFADEPTGQLNSTSSTNALDVLTEFNNQGQSGECELGKYKAGDKARHEKLTSFLSEMGW